MPVDGVERVLEVICPRCAGVALAPVSACELQVPTSWTADCAVFTFLCPGCERRVASPVTQAAAGLVLLRGVPVTYSTDEIVPHQHTDRCDPTGAVRFGRPLTAAEVDAAAAELDAWGGRLDGLRGAPS